MGSPGARTSADKVTGAPSPQTKRTVTFLIDNASDDLDLFALPNYQWLKHFPTGNRSIRFPMQVAFAERDSVVVGSSDCGLVYVFGVEDGEEIDRLRHGTRGLVQCVVVSVSVCTLPSCSNHQIPRPASRTICPILLLLIRVQDVPAPFPYGDLT